MKLYLSSYHLGNKSHKLQELVGVNKKAALVTNALDHSDDLARRKKSVSQDVTELTELGFIPEELDLREYFGKSHDLKAKVAEYGLLWVRGGNCFVLRRAMQESGLDEIIKSYKGKNDIVYGGFSAGVCVLSPTLKGIDLVDDPAQLPHGYKNQQIWEGLGLISYSIAPHYKSDHPESEVINKVVEYFIENKMPYKTLQDGEVIIEDY